MNDLIDRRVAIDAVLSVIPYDDYWKEQIEKVVNKLPSAQPEHKKSTDNGCTFLTCKHGGFGDDACSKCRWAYRDMYEANEEGARE